MSDFDFERAVAGLTGGYPAILALDQSRQGRLKDVEDKKRAAAELAMKQAEESRRVADEGRKAKDFDFDFGEKQAAAPFRRQQLELDTQGKADDVEGKRLALDLKRAENDPASEYSRTLKSGLAAQFRAFASTLQQRGSPDAALYLKAADDVEKNSHLGGGQVVDAVKPLADAAGFNLKALHDQATEANANAQLGLARANFGETRRMHDASIGNMEADNARAFDMTVKKPQEKLNREINDIEVGVDEMKELEKKKEKVNTGPVISFVLDTLGLGKFDELKSADRKDLEALAARVFNKETKSIAGATVTPSEWARIEPMIPKVKGDDAGAADDDEAFRTKLARAIKESNRILRARRLEYQRTPAGNTIDTSVVAQEANAQAQPKMTAEDRQALQWYNDPANKADPARAGVGAVLKKKGFIK